MAFSIFYWANYTQGKIIPEVRKRRGRWLGLEVFVWHWLTSCWILSAMSPEIQEWSHKSRSRINNLYLHALLHWVSEVGAMILYGGGGTEAARCLFSQESWWPFCRRPQNLSSPSSGVHIFVIFEDFWLLIERTVILYWIKQALCPNKAIFSVKKIHSINDWGAWPPAPHPLTEKCCYLNLRSKVRTQLARCGKFYYSRM